MNLKDLLRILFYNAHLQPKKHPELSTWVSVQILNCLGTAKTEIKIMKTNVIHSKSLIKRSAILISCFLKNLSQMTVIIKIISPHNSTSITIFCHSLNTLYSAFSRSGFSGLHLVSAKLQIIGNYSRNYSFIIVGMWMWLLQKLWEQF